MTEPWDKYLPVKKEQSFTVHGREFVITNDIEASSGVGTGRALFSQREVMLLKQANPGGKLPRSLSLALHKIKRIIGGEVVSCVMDSKPAGR